MYVLGRGRVGVCATQVGGLPAGFLLGPPLTALPLGQQLRRALWAGETRGGSVRNCVWRAESGRTGRPEQGRPEQLSKYLELIVSLFDCYADDAFEVRAVVFGRDHVPFRLRLGRRHFYGAHWLVVVEALCARAGSEVGLIPTKV